MNFTRPCVSSDIKSIRTTLKSSSYTFHELVLLLLLLLLMILILMLMIMMTTMIRMMAIRLRRRRRRKRRRRRVEMTPAVMAIRAWLYPLFVFPIWLLALMVSIGIENCVLVWMCTPPLLVTCSQSQRSLEDTHTVPISWE